ncbi:MAG: tRNA (N(6)-L-threonylcarbamoyladenosine(37)-C(2))-methylthiotransferase MtaB [Selenomonadaceae bacterium]|nr:tRNA (N(6)-L-threonylcarbamoyladenosine(37)-C(2))-methylthiotransferase MtaB [Selenomonadaceae bacterium]MBR1858949.1 tRNA (N(6)-L-threonylcarbamoyladenosine(37)-C(2))-methylthiotransferase MtaB [Selenomonadaceae bacterium]
MKIQIENIGCKVNMVESESIAELFQQRGHKIVKRGADVVVINTCCVTTEAEAKSRQAIRRALKNGSEVAIMGCYGQLSPDELKQMGVRVIIGTAQRQSIVDKVEAMVDEPKVELTAYDKIFGETEKVTIPELATEYEELPHTPSKTRAFIKIQDGCNGGCTYCVIPTVRGKSRSRSLESIKKECKQLSKYKEIVLTGINLGMYGKDTGSSLADAIKTVLSSTKARIRLSSINPNSMTDDIIELLRDKPRLCKHIHIPLQSGSDAVLEMMHRPYKTADFKQVVERLKSEIPKITIGTDVILGFSGETLPMFRETMKFLEEMPIDYMHVFGYSPRPGTIAAEMTQIASQKKKARVNYVISLATKKNLAYRQSLQGKKVEVLTEVKKGGYTEGYSGEYVKVYTEDDVPLNEIVKLKVVEPFKDGVLGKVDN